MTNPTPQQKLSCFTKAEKEGLRQSIGEYGYYLNDVQIGNAQDLIRSVEDGILLTMCSRAAHYYGQGVHMLNAMKAYQTEMSWQDREQFEDLVEVVIEAAEEIIDSISFPEAKPKQKYPPLKVVKSSNELPNRLRA